MLYKILIKDNREPFNVIQKNDPAKLNYKSEWIKFTVKNLYDDTNIGKLSKKSNRKSKKVTDLKTKELNENAMERKCTWIVHVIFGKGTFNLFLTASFFPSTL